jgi:hypothetical protein
VILFGAEYADEKRKGYRELVQAIRRCLKIGDFSAMARTDRVCMMSFGHPAKEIASTGIKVVRLGYLNTEEDIRSAYAAADIFVQSSLEDNLPNTMLEAMSCGTPVVAFDVGGMPEVIESGVNGLLAAQKDPQGLAGAITELTLDGEKRDAFGTECAPTDGRTVFPRPPSPAVFAPLSVHPRPDLEKRDGSTAGRRACEKDGGKCGGGSSPLRRFRSAGRNHQARHLL